MAHPERFLMAGVMGWPVMHSRSPLIHNHWLKQHGLAGVYVPLAVKVENLASALRALPALGFSGCNLTLPHKIEALSILDHVDPLARRIGAVNCVVVGADGSLTGRNYDAFGFVESVIEAKPDWRGDAGPAVVLGSGGGARAVVASLAEKGARDIRIANRTFDKAAALAADFGGIARAVPWSDRDLALEGAATLVNTTSLGMAGQGRLEISLDRLPVSALVSDIIYIPRETPLLEAGRKRGNPTVNGLGMLLHQARPAFRDWFGVMPQATHDLRAMVEATI